MSLDSFVKTSRPIPQPICTSAPIRDRDSTFVAVIYRTTSPATAQAIAKHVKNVVHASNRASHEMMAYRIMSLRSGRNGLSGPEDFEVNGKSTGGSRSGSRSRASTKGASEDDGEKYGGSRILKIMQREGVLDAVVVVSRWYGGTMLGPIRFTHIEECTSEVCSRFKTMEELEAHVERLRGLDHSLADLRATLPDNGTTIPSKTQDYSALLASLDVAKVRRLIKARESAVRSVETLLAKDLEKSAAAASNHQHHPEASL